MINQTSKKRGIFNLLNKIKYNSPVILTFTFLCIIVMILSDITNGKSTRIFFSTSSGFNITNILWYIQLVTHALGHANWNHLIGNCTLILLIGPMIEEKYGSKSILQMMLIVSIFISLTNTVLFSNVLLGASGIVFCFILVASLSNFKEGEIPLTFILVAFVFLGREIIQSFTEDNISQLAHIIGGICGAIWGFAILKIKK